MPPSKRTQEDGQTLKEKLHSLKVDSARVRRHNGHTAANGNVVNGSALKEVMSSNGDNASIQSAQNEHTSGVGGLPLPLNCNYFEYALLILVQMSWNTQDGSVLQGYRRAYRLDTPSAFKGSASHIVLNQGIGKYSPTMARPKSKRRVEKTQLSLAVRKNFNAQAVSETHCIVDWIYTVKNQGRLCFYIGGAILIMHLDKEFRVRFAPQRK